VDLENPDQLIELSYISKATQDMGLSSLIHLFDVSLKWNDDHGLTGVLFYENQFFSQIIEGRRSDVQMIWEKIQKDYRHHVVRQLAFNGIQERAFPNWGIRFYGGDLIAKDVPHLTGLLDGIPDHDVELLAAMRSVSDGAKKQ
jgi:hypothetical protein